MFKAYRFVFIAILACFALTQCTSAPNRAKAPQDHTEVQKPSHNLEGKKDSEYWLSEAWQVSSNIAKQPALVQAALALQNEKQWEKSAAVLSQIARGKLADNTHQYYRLARARWYAHNKDWRAVNRELKGLPELLTQKEFKRLALELQSFSAKQQYNFWHALTSQVEAQRYSAKSSPEQLWQTARQVTPEQMPPARPTELTLAGWWRLIDNHHQAMNAPKTFIKSLLNWQDSFPNHPANSLVQNWISSNKHNLVDANEQREKCIVVLLPLSGRYKPQGLAVRDGIIANVSDSSTVALKFIDTNELTFEQQQLRIQQLQPSGIIGPLLKDSVSHWATQSTLAIPQVFLNQVDDTSATNEHRLFFALNPEAEAQQASVFMSNTTSSTKRPLILAANTASAQRMVQHYQASWPLPNEPSVSLFNQREDMKSAVEGSLGLVGSKKRIRAVKIAAGKIIVDEQERSRRDISAIYLPGNLQQVRLLKPFIDVSISPFAERVPTYGSSSAHELTNQFGDTDLNGLVFTETPWLIRGNGGDELLNQWLEARSGWELSQARLGAMGYDSVDLVQRLPIISRMPGARWDGLSGTLRAENQIVYRQLQWAAFKNSRITLLEEQPSAGEINR